MDPGTGADRNVRRSKAGVKGPQRFHGASDDAPWKKLTDFPESYPEAVTLSACSTPASMAS